MTAPASDASICNAMTVDVEDYYHANVFDDTVDRSTWSGLESRVVPQHRAGAGADARRRRARHVLHPGLRRRAVPLAGPHHRGRGARNRVARLRAPPHHHPDARCLSRRHPPGEGHARKRRGRQRARLPRAELLRHAQDAVGARHHRRRGLPLRLQRLSDPSRSHTGFPTRRGIRTRSAVMDGPCSKCPAPPCALAG